MVTRKTSARNPELEIMLGRRKTQLLDLASSGIRDKAPWGMRVEGRGGVERAFLILEWELGPKGIQPGNPVNIKRIISIPQILKQGPSQASKIL